MSVLFYLGARLSLALAVGPEVLVVLWIPNAILLVALLHGLGTRGPVLAVLVLAAELAADGPAFGARRALLFGLANLAEVTLAWGLLRRWRFDPALATPADIAKLVAAGPVLGALLGALMGAATYRIFGHTDHGFLSLVRVWWFSDGLGLLILTPLVLTWWPPAGRRERGRPRLQLRWFDLVAFVLSAPVVAAVALAEQRRLAGLPIRTFLLLPPILYVAARSSVAAAASAVAAGSALLLWVVRNGQQPFGDVPLSETVISAQELIFVMSTIALGIATLLAQQRRLAEQLEVRVRARTAALSAATAELEKLAFTDTLTGLLNRRALFDRLALEMERERRHPQGLALIVLDVDHFKAVNDRHGHSAGDAVLREIAGRVGRHVRGTDLVARYGGEELVVVAPSTDAATAVRLAERLREELRGEPVAAGEHVIPLTASFGVTVMTPQDAGAESIFQRADRALYAAKAAGRDCVVSEPRPASD